MYHLQQAPPAKAGEPARGSLDGRGTPLMTASRLGAVDETRLDALQHSQGLQIGLEDRLLLGTLVGVLLAHADDGA
jgi:hypothetical protein